MHKSLATRKMQISSHVVCIRPEKMMPASCHVYKGGAVLVWPLWVSQWRVTLLSRSAAQPTSVPLPWHDPALCFSSLMSLLLLPFSLSVRVWLFHNLMDCSSPGSSVHGISKVRTLEQLAISFSRESSWPKDQTPFSHNPGRFFTTEPPGKPCLVDNWAEWKTKIWPCWLY